MKKKAINSKLESNAIKITKNVNTKRVVSKISQQEVNQQKFIHTPSGDKTVNEVKFQITNNEKVKEMKELFATTSKALQLLDLTKTESRTFTVYNKDLLRTYLRNPKSYEKNLRSLSKFLYRLSYNYRQLVWYFASMIDLNIVSVIPLLENEEDNDIEAKKKLFFSTSIKLEQMKMAINILPLLLTTWREDTIYGYVYDDDVNMFIQILDGDYCRISSVENGCLRFAYDFSYFRQHKEELEYWDSEFQSKYNAYDKDSSLRWQELEYGRQICLKVNNDDWKMDYPPFAALFEQLIDLIDLQSIQSVKDEMSIYKMLVARLKPLDRANAPDMFEVDPATAIEYYNKWVDTLPEGVRGILSPVPIEAVEFKNNPTDTNNSIADATENLFASATASPVLYSKTSNGTLITSQIINDSMISTSSLLPQIERWVNNYMTYSIGDHAYVKYIDITKHTRETARKNALEDCTYGAPKKLLLSALSGYTPLQTASLLFLENDVLGLADKMIPLQCSNTQSGNGKSGGQEKDIDELSDGGLETRDKDKNGM